TSSAACPSLAPFTSYPRASSRALSTSTLSSCSSTTRIRFLGSCRDGVFWGAFAGASVAIVAAKESLHLCDDRSRLAGLREISVTPHFVCFFPVGRQGVRRQSNDRDVFRRRIMLQDLCRLPPIDYRNRNIHKNEIRLS